MAPQLDQRPQKPLAQLLADELPLKAIGDFNARQWTSLLGGGALALYGLSRRSLTGLILAGVGGALAYRTMQEVAPHAQRPPDIGAGSAAAWPGEAVIDNEVDEASWESYPASDPPSTY